MQHSHSRHQKTNSNLLRINFKTQTEVQQLTATRRSYVHKPIVKFSGASPKCLLFANFSKYLWFKTKQFTGLLEFVKLYKQNSLKKLFLLHYLPKLYIGFKLKQRLKPIQNNSQFSLILKIFTCKPRTSGQVGLQCT